MFQTKRSVHAAVSLCMTKKNRNLSDGTTAELVCMKYNLIILLTILNGSCIGADNKGLNVQKFVK